MGMHALHFLHFPSCQFDPSASDHIAQIERSQHASRHNTSHVHRWATTSKQNYWQNILIHKYTLMCLWWQTPRQKNNVRFNDDDAKSWKIGLLVWNPIWLFIVDTTFRCSYTALKFYFVSLFAPAWTNRNI